MFDFFSSETDDQKLNLFTKFVVAQTMDCGFGNCSEYLSLLQVHRRFVVFQGVDITPGKRVCIGNEKITEINKRY